MFMCPQMPHESIIVLQRTSLLGRFSFKSTEGIVPGRLDGWRIRTQLPSLLRHVPVGKMARPRMHTQQQQALGPPSPLQSFTHPHAHTQQQQRSHMHTAPASGTVTHAGKQQHAFKTYSGDPRPHAHTHSSNTSR
jgi:hypothetical protein